MKNVDRLARLVTKKGTENVLIHSITNSQNWIVGQKINEEEWLMTLCNPMKNVTYNLGIITNGAHIKLWEELTKLELNTRLTTIKIAKEMRNLMKQFMNKNNYKYKRFTKRK
jgi:hypothetical protein